MLMIFIWRVSCTTIQKWSGFPLFLFLGEGSKKKGTFDPFRCKFFLGSLTHGAFSTRPLCLGINPFLILGDHIREKRPRKMRERNKGGWILFALEFLFLLLIATIVRQFCRMDIECEGSIKREFPQFYYMEYSFPLFWLMPLEEHKIDREKYHYAIFLMPWDERLS